MKKVLPFLATFILLLSSAYFSKLQAQTVWDGTSDDTWYDASQSSFILSTPEELAGLSTLVAAGNDFSGKTVTLSADIWLNADGDSTNNWVPIGASPTALGEGYYYGYAFKGTFDGAHHIIYNMYIDKSSNSVAGFFGKVQTATITGVAFINPVVKALGMAGTIVGSWAGTGSNTISDCQVINTRVITTSVNNNGGIVGACYPGSISYVTSCAVSGTVTGNYAGGIGGNSQNLYITNSYFAGTINALGNNPSGGLTAYSGNITNSYSNINSGSGYHGTYMSLTDMQATTFPDMLDNTFVMDNGINNGYPIKKWLGVTITGTHEICVGESTILSASNDYVSYSWSTGATTQSIMVTPSTTTIYSVTAVNNNGQTSSANFTVIVHPQADINVTVMPSSDGLLHGTVTPESTSVGCGSTTTADITITPDQGWHISGIYVNDNQVSGEILGSNPTTFAVDPQGTLCNVKVYFNNKFTIVASTLDENDNPINNNLLFTPYGSNGSTDVTEGQDLTYNFKTSFKYHITDLEVDGISMGAITEYEFTDIAQSHTIVARYNTSCGITELPTYDNFDTYPSSSSLPEDCWGSQQTYVSSNSYPITYTTNHSAPNSMCLRANAGTYSVCIFPQSSFALNTLQVDMDLRVQSASSGGNILLGVIEDSTFVTIDTISFPPTSTEWYNRTGYLTSYTGNSEYIALKWENPTSAQDIYIDNIFIRQSNGCPNVIDLTVEEVYGNKALISWSYTSAITPAYFNVTVTNMETGNETTMQTDNTTYLIENGISELTVHQVSVSAICTNGDESNTQTATFTTPCLNPIDISVGENLTTSTSYGYIPSYGYYKYSFTEQIYTVNELGTTPRNLSSLSVKSLTNAMTRNCDVYLMLVDSTADVGNGFISSTGATLVHSGNINFLNGDWTTIAFDVPFYYDGESNLLVIFDDNTGSYTSSYSRYLTYTHEEGSARFVYNDITDYSPTNVSAGSPTTYKNVIKFTYCGSADCIRPNAFGATHVEDTWAELTWLNGSDESSYIIQYKTADATDWTEISNVTGLSYTLDNLLPHTTYEVRAQSICNSSLVSEWTNVVTFTTESCPASDLCSYTFHLTSNPSATYHLTLNTIIKIYQNGVLCKTIDPSATEETHSINLCDGANIEIAGIFADTWTPCWINIEFTDPSNTITLSIPNLCDFSNNNNVEQTLYTFTASCAMPTCLRPDTVTVTNITENSAALNFNDPSNNGTGWIIEYGIDGFTHGSGTFVYTNTLPFTLQNLTPGQRYKFYVQTICDNDSSYVSEYYHFNTLCGDLTSNDLPYTHNFEGSYDTETKVPFCWSSLTTDPEHYVYVASSSYYSHGGSQYLDFHYTPNCTDMVILPTFDNTVNISDLAATFWLRANDSGIGAFEIGVLEDTSDITSFVTIDTCSPAQTSVYTEFIIPFSSYTGTGKNIAFRYSNATNYSYLLDDITISIAPSCIHPNNLTYSNVTNNSVNLSWNERDNATSWSVEYGAPGFTPGTGTVVVASNNTAFTLDNLNYSTTYDCYVFSNCPDGGHSNYSTKITFTTDVECPTPTNLILSNIDETTAEISWTENGNASQWHIYWGVAGFNPMDSTAVFDDMVTISNPFTITGLTSGTNYTVYVTAYCESGNLTELSSAANFHTTICPASSQCEYRIDMHDSYGDGWNNNKIEVYNNNILVETVTLNSGNNGTAYVSICDNSTLSLKWVRGYYPSETSFTVYGPYEDIVLYTCTNGSSITSGSEFFTTTADCTIPFCTRPDSITVSNITNNSADIDWNDLNGNGNGWWIEYGTSGFAQGSGTTIYTTSHPYTLTNLTTASSYDFYITTDCTSDTSLITNVQTFSTPCDDIATLPYLENFDNHGGQVWPSCWTKYASDASHMVYIYEVSYHSAPYCMDFHWTPSCYTIAAMPQLSSTFNLSDLRLNMWLTQTIYGATLEVGTMANGNDFDSFQVFETIQCNTINAWEEKVVDFSNYTGTDRVIAFRVANAGNGGFRLDDVVLDYSPACPAPENVSIVSTTNNSVTITWTEPSTSTSWNIMYGATGFNVANGGTAINGVTTNTYTITGLTTNTAYDFYIQSNCNATETSYWSAPVTGTPDSTTTSTCNAPTNVTAGNITSNGATITWTPGGNETAWEVSYHVIGSTSVINNMSVNSPTATLTGLTASTMYEVCVAAICSTSETSDCANVTFTTLDPSVVTYTITPSAGANGTITPNTPQVVTSGANVAFTMTADEGYLIQNVLVDNNSVFFETDPTTTYTYTFMNITANHSIAVEFQTNGVNNYDLNGSIAIYPNPTQNVLNIALTDNQLQMNGEITLVDMCGKVVSTANGYGQSTQINVQSLSNGVYFIRINTNNGMVTKKFIKE